MGFDINNDFFEQNSKYFRDSLVRANYQDLKRDISHTREFLNKFFENLLLEGKNKLDSKYLIISIGQKDKNVSVNQRSVRVKTIEKILSLIKENNKITVNEMARRIGRTPRSVERAIQKLKQSNKIKRVGSDKTGTWNIL